MMLKKLKLEMIRLKSWSWWGEGTFGPYDRMGESHGASERGLVIFDMFDSMNRKAERERERTLYFLQNWETVKPYIFSLFPSPSPSISWCSCLPSFLLQFPLLSGQFPHYSASLYRMAVLTLIL